LVLSLFVLGCPQPYLPEPDPPDPDPILPPGVDPAEAACERFEQLGCKDIEGRNLWEPTNGGVACVDIFRNAEEQGVNLHPACIAKIEICPERHICTDKD
jgi:hypothetical protein